MTDKFSGPMTDRQTTVTTMTTSIHPHHRPPPRAVAPLGHAAFDLLEQARLGLTVAAMAPSAPQRFVVAHLAALRAGAAVLAARARPRSTRGPRNVWTVLPQVAPSLAEWAPVFAASATKRAAIEAGLARVVTDREADDLLREAEHFAGLVAVHLGVPHQQMLAAP